MPDAAAAPDPAKLLRSREYVRLLVLAAVIGIPVSALSYGFLKAVSAVQDLLFSDLPDALGFASTPAWWPIPIVAAGGLLCALAIHELPGTGGHEPSAGFHAGGALPPVQLTGVVAAAFATLAFGAVLGPEAPLILLGSGVGALAVKLAAKDAPPRATTVVAAAGSFAAISSLLGSPLLGAFLLLEAAGIGGPIAGLVLLPGLLAAGVGTLIFIGLDSLTGYGTFSLALPGLPPFDHPTGAMFLWALAFGLVAAALGRVIALGGRGLQPVVARRRLMLTPLVGLVVGGIATLFTQITSHPASDVLYSGQDQLPGLISSAATYSTGALIALIVCKSVAYALSLSAFRGGPVFPSMFIGAAIGVAAADLPGLELVPSIAMGIGAMCAVMLSLPLTATLLATLLLGTDGLAAMPVVIVAVVVAYVAAAHLTPAPAPAPEPQPAPAVPAAA